MQQLRVETTTDETATGETVTDGYTGGYTGDESTTLEGIDVPGTRERSTTLEETAVLSLGGIEFNLAKHP